MSQKLILPINKCRLTASWKTQSYLDRFGFVHYGADMVSSAGDRAVFASGNGTVAAVGRDNVVGNVVAVVYPKALNHRKNQVHDVTLRYYHFESVSVQVGQIVNKDTRLGIYGKIGSMDMSNHLHLEIDTDTKHPLHSPTVLNSNFLKGRAVGASDKTMSSPLDWLHCKIDAPDLQTYSTVNDIYIAAADKIIPNITGTVADDSVGIEGIDVSVHNGAVDFNKVKASGKDFVFVRVGWAGWDGRIVAHGGPDKRFHENMKAAIAAGLDVGVYVYSYCKTPEAARIAAHETLELVKPYNLTYPIAFDIEDTTDAGVRYDKMPRVENTAIVDAYLATIKRAGYYGMIYTYKHFAEAFLDMAALSEWDIWIAHYAAVNGYKGSHGIWQYMGDVKGFIGSCPGVTGPCDLNVAYKDYAALIAAGEMNEPAAPEIDPCDCKALGKEIDVLRRELSTVSDVAKNFKEKLKQINEISS